MRLLQRKRRKSRGGSSGRVYNKLRKSRKVYISTFLLKSKCIKSPTYIGLFILVFFNYFLSEIMSFKVCFSRSFNLLVM